MTVSFEFSDRSLEDWLDAQRQIANRLAEFSNRSLEDWLDAQRQIARLTPGRF